MFRFLHAADIHLDSPLRGLERYEGAPVEEVRSAPRRAFENLVRFAIEEKVAFVLLAGDLYDGDWKDYNTGLFFVRQMRRLEEAGIDVHLIAGNHDASSQITRQLSLPSNVVLYSTAAPQTVELRELGVAIHGQGFETQNVTRDLAADFPMGEPGRFDIGLLHTSLTGREGHENYAPTSVGELTSKGYDYWALGHVHNREVVSRDPWIVFPGNLQGRHARETGPKGATLVTVEDSEVVQLVHHAFDVVRWERIEVDISHAGDADEIGELARQAIEGVTGSGTRLLAVRLLIVGRSEAHSTLAQDPERWVQELRSQLSVFGGGGVFLEKVQMDSRSPVDLGATLEREDALGEWMRLISGLEDSSIDLRDYMESFAEIRKKLPPGLLSKRNPDRFDPTDPDCVRELLPAVRDLLVARLLDAEDGV